MSERKNERTELQKKAVEIAEGYMGLRLQEKINVIAKAFGCTSGHITTSLCRGKWRGTSDISICFDNGASLFIGNRLTPKAKTVTEQTECVNSALVQFNPEIIQASKDAALPVLLQREVKDNEIAAQKVFFVKYFSLKKASEFPFFSKGFSLPSAGIMHLCA